MGAEVLGGEGLLAGVVKDGVLKKLLMNSTHFFFFYTIPKFYFFKFRKPGLKINR